MRRGVLIGVGCIVMAAAIAAGCGLTDGLTGAPEEDAGAADATDELLGTCDAELARSVENCGACGRACAFGSNSFAICDAGACALGCVTGFGDCDDASANGCETNLMNGGSNCGKCGHSCLGGTCAAGACQPFVMCDTVNAPVQIVADDVFIYGINGYGTVTSVAKDGGSGCLQIVGGDTTLQSPPPQIAMAAGTLYYTSFSDGGAPDGAPGGRVTSLPIDGGKAGGKATVTPAYEPFAISATATYVYWTEGNPAAPSPSGTVMRCKASNCPSSREPIATHDGGQFYSIVADEKSVTWTDTAPDGGGVTRCTDSKNCAILDDSPKPRSYALVQGALAQGESAFFWTTTNGTLVSCPARGCSGAPTVLDSHQPNLRFLAYQQNALFWTSADGTVKTRATTLPPPPTTPPIARTLYDSHDGSPWDIVVDPVAIYWTDAPTSSSRALYRLAR